MHKTSVEIAGTELIVEYDFDITAHGCSAHMGSLSYEGHPAEPAEFVVNILGIRFPKQGADIPQLEIPRWLEDVLTSHLYECDDINDVVQKADMERSIDER